MAITALIRTTGRPRGFLKALAVSAFLIVCIAPALKAQQDTFVVKTAKSVITVLPATNILYVNEDNRITIRYKGKYKISKVQLLGGTIDKKNDSNYVLKVTTGVEAVLSVYEKLTNGTERLAMNKKYKIYSRPLPDVTLDGVKCDSVVDKFTVIASGRLYARSKYTREKYTIKSFTMEMPGGGKDTLNAEGNQMTQDMKIAVDKMPKGQGGMLIFRNIVCIMPNGEERKLATFRVYLSEVKPTKVGM